MTCQNRVNPEYKQNLHPLTFAGALAAVGFFSVCQPVTAACIVPALPTAACAAVMPGNERIYSTVTFKIKLRKLKIPY